MFGLHHGIVYIVRAVLTQRKPAAACGIRIRARTSLAAIALIAVTITRAVAGSDVRPLASVPEFSGLSQRWAEAAETFHLAGYAVAVLKDGQVLAMEGFGIRDASGELVTSDTMFYVASCTKTYTAFGLAVLAEAGAVDLDAPVKSYLPRFRLADEELTATVTVRDLLCHKLGINSDPIVFLDAYTGQITEDRYYYWLREVEPTRRVEYTNVHYTLAGRVIEAVTGMSWKDFLDEEVFEPAGLRRTTAYASQMYADSNVAFPLEGAPGAYARSPVRKTDRVMHAAGGMGTTVSDAAVWLLLHMDPGAIDGVPLVSSQMMDQILQFQSTLEEPRGRIRRIEGFGLAWFRGTYRGHGPYYQHSGGYIGTAAHLSFLPEHRIGVVVLANASPGGQAFIDIASIDVYDRLLGESSHKDLLPVYEKRIKELRGSKTGKSEAGEPVAAEMLSTQPLAYVGTFSNPHWGDLSITVSSHKLHARIGDLPLTLRTVGIDQFRASTPSDEYDGAFAVDDAGIVSAVTLVLHGDESIEFTRR